MWIGYHICVSAKLVFILVLRELEVVPRDRIELPTLQFQSCKGRLSVVEARICVFRTSIVTRSWT